MALKNRKWRNSKVRQHDISDCGPACIASVCAYYGLHVAVSQIRRTAFTNQNGSSVMGLVEAANSLNFNAKGMRADYASLYLTSLPAIVHIAKDNTTHYMVLLKVNRWGVIVMDPAEGRLKKICEKEFRQIWTGIIILLIPGEQFKKNEKVSPFTRLKELIVPFKHSLIIIAVWACVASLLGLSMSLYIKEVVDEILVNREIARLDMISVTVLIVLLIQFLVTIARNGMSFKIGKTINQGLITGYYNHLLKLPQTFFDSMRVGEMLSRINDAVKITAFIQELAVNLVVNILVVVFSLGMMIYYNWRIAIMIMMMLPVYCLLYYLSSKVNQGWQRKIAVSGAEFDTFLVESIGAATTIRNFSAEPYFIKRAEMKLTELLNNIYHFSSRQTLVHAVAELSSKFFMVLLLWIGSYHVTGRQMTAGELISFYTLLAWVTMPLLYVLEANKHLCEALIATERLVEILEIQPERNGRIRISGSNSVGVQFESVVFAYGMNEPILRGINLYIPPGRITGISGKSGSGKSTLASLLLRMHKPASGSIFINSIHINDIEKKSLTGLISIVSQESEIFSASITENIILGEKFDEEKLNEICEHIGIMKFAATYPEGMNTMVMERGCNLSGGQKQRIAIARALYRNTPVLILDEATVSIDETSEQKIMQTIEWYKNKGNTVIIIAHSESTLKICDNIAVLEDGVIK